MNNNQLSDACLALNIGESLLYPEVDFEQLFDLKYPTDKNGIMYPITHKNFYRWHCFKITAKLRVDLRMSLCFHNPKKVCKTGEEVLIVLPSRLGDLCVKQTSYVPGDSASYYSARVLAKDLYDLTITRVREDLTPILGVKHRTKPY